MVAEAIQKGEIYSNHFDLRDKTAVTEDVAISPILVRDGLPQTDTALKSSSVPSKASTNHEGPWLAEFSRFQPFAEDPPRLCSGFFLGHHTHFQGLSSSGTCPWPPSPTPAQSSLRQPRCRWKGPGHVPPHRGNGVLPASPTICSPHELGILGPLTARGGATVS